MSWERRHARGLSGLDETGGEHVDTDLGMRKNQRTSKPTPSSQTHLVGSPLGSEAATEVGDGALGRVVEALSEGRVDNLGRHGRDDDDGSGLLALDPEGGGGLAGLEDTEDVDSKDFVEVVRGELESGLDDGDARVCYEPVDLPKILLNLVERLGNVVHRAGDVALVLFGVELSQ